MWLVALASLLPGGEARAYCRTSTCDDCPRDENGCTVGGTDASPQTGQFFGYRTAINSLNGTGSENINYDNFSAIPEPASAGLVGFAAAGLLARRRGRGRRPAC